MLRAYAKWGFFGKDWLINKALSFRSHQNSPTQLGASAREAIRTSLLSEKKRIQVEDYLERLGFAVSRRIAQLDLARDSRFEKIGNTRAAFFRPKAS
jgi:hypothetical protein